MKAVVIGLGSMGKRRVRLINQYDTGMEIIGVDSNVERRAESEAVFGIKTCASLAESGAMEGDAALVCSSPLSHASLITDCLNRKMHVFTELNLVMDRYDENISLAKETSRVLFLSSPFLYRAENQFIINVAQNSLKPLHYTYHIGQYLPDWHPWEKYQNFLYENYG